MGALAIRLAFEPLRLLAAGSIGGSYASIGNPFANPARQLLVQNGTDAAVFFSLDGIEDHFFLPSGGFLLLDVTSNKTIVQGFYIAQGTTIYVKQSGVPSTGSVFASVIYGIGDER